MLTHTSRLITKSLLFSFAGLIATQASNNSLINLFNISIINSYKNYKNATAISKNKLMNPLAKYLTKKCCPQEWSNIEEYQESCLQELTYRCRNFFSLVCQHETAEQIEFFTYLLESDPKLSVKFRYHILLIANHNNDLKFNFSFDLNEYFINDMSNSKLWKKAHLAFQQLNIGYAKCTISHSPITPVMGFQ